MPMEDEKPVGRFLKILRDDQACQEDVESTRTNPPRPEDLGIEQRPHAVILLHGIRTFGEWMDDVKPVLEKDPSIRVVKPKYGRFDLARFLGPTNFFAQKPLRKIADVIRVESEKPTTKMVSIIAHSFGSFLIAELLKRDEHIRLHKLILAGSIVKEDFNWLKLQHKVGEDRSVYPSILNERATKDVWPRIATRITFVYGASGVRGFHDDSFVKNRIHRFGHSGCLNARFASDYWLPFLATCSVEK